MRCFVWTQMENLQENLELPPDLSSTTQKDAKPINDHMGEAFESHPGIPVSRKTEQRRSSPYKILCSLRETKCSQGYKHWWLSVKRLMSTDLSTGLGKISQIQQTLSSADVSDVFQHLEKIFLWDISISVISKSTLSSSYYGRRDIGFMLKCRNGLTHLLLCP